METRLKFTLNCGPGSNTDPTYKEWKLISCQAGHVLKSLYTDPTYKEWKRYSKQWETVNFIDTDPTYKEWKPRYAEIFNGTSENTDPTYKEWKLQMPITERASAGYTDPTYKEWKLGSLVGESEAKMRHGSYLQGMETKGAQGEGEAAIETRILPTRNGNRSRGSGNMHFSRAHGSYLQGMETGCSISN